MKSYVKGRRNQACVALIDHLAAMGIVAMTAHNGKGNVLFAYCRRREDIERVPPTFEGWDVVAAHQSEIDFGEGGGDGWSFNCRSEEATARGDGA